MNTKPNKDHYRACPTKNQDPWDKVLAELGRGNYFIGEVSRKNWKSFRNLLNRQGQLFMSVRLGEKMLVLSPTELPAPWQVGWLTQKLVPLFVRGLAMAQWPEWNG